MIIKCRFSLILHCLCCCHGFCLKKGKNVSRFSQICVVDYMILSDLHVQFVYDMQIQVSQDLAFYVLKVCPMGLELFQNGKVVGFKGLNLITMSSQQSLKSAGLELSSGKILVTFSDSVGLYG